METAEALICDVGVEAAISAAYRVGAVVGSRPRTLVVKFQTEQNRYGVYNKLRNLRGKQRWNQISVAPDLTKIQCQEEKATVDVVYTWKYGGPHIVTTIYANEMKLCVYNAYVL